MKKILLFFAAFIFCSPQVTAPFLYARDVLLEIPHLAAEKQVDFKSDYQEREFVREDLNISLPKKERTMALAILSELPENHTLPLKKIEAEYGENVKRGLASFKSIYLGVDVIDTEHEFRRVFIHEMGHVVDLGMLRPTKKVNKSNFMDGSNIIYETDPSLEFYSLCWTSEFKQNNKCSDLDFASEYSKTDVFEDFAESYLLFTENNLSFQLMAEESDVMKKKFDFFAKTVFKGDFEKTKASALLKPGERVWDLTKVN